MKCLPCSDEFGAGTVDCSREGALTCEAKYFASLVTVDESVYPSKSLI